MTETNEVSLNQWSEWEKKHEWVKNIIVDDIEVYFDGTYEELKELTITSREFHCFDVYGKDIDIDREFEVAYIIRDWCIRYMRHQQTNYDELLKYAGNDNTTYHHIKSTTNEAIFKKLPYLR